MGRTDMFNAPEVAAIAKSLIGQYHTHLEDAHLLYVFTRKPRSKAGKTILGTAQKASGVAAFLSARVDEATGELYTADFILVFSWAEWEGLTEEQHLALVDHELCHCDAKEDKYGNVTWTLRGHDVEEFSEIIQRHGLWKPDVESFVRAAEQLSLPV